MTGGVWGDGKGDEVFKWGAKGEVGTWNKGIQSYNSFTYRGVKYEMYDCVHVCHDDCTESYIGKIVKMWTTDGEKKVKLVWFFRPLEIRRYLRDYKPLWNELFLASGSGSGVTNIISPECIMRKCNVVCTSEDVRNPRATEKELEMAEYFFSCIFDVAKSLILRNLPDRIIRIRVDNFLNKRKEQTNISSGMIKPKMSVCGELGVSSKVNNQSVIVGKSAGISSTPRESLCAEKCVSSESSPLRPKTSVPPDGEGPSVTPHIQAINKVEVSSPIGSSNLRGEPKNSVPCDGAGHSNTPHNRAMNKVKVSCPTVSSTCRDKPKNSVPLDGGGHSNTPHNQAINKVKESLPTDPSILLDKPKKHVPHNGVGRSSTPHNQVINLAKVSLPMGSSACQDKSEVTPFRKRKFVQGDCGRNNSNKASSQPEEGRTEKQIIDTRSWFKPLSWEERLQTADGAGTLVLLENLDPSFTSFEVKDLIWRALNERVEARMLQHSSLSNPCYGEAFVIFRSKDAANAAIMKLGNRCLMVNGRVLIARAEKLQNHGKAKMLTGHLKIRTMRGVSEEWKKSVSTSHSAQPNTIEYEMALDWVVQHKQSEWCWQKLRQRQKEEIDQVRKSLHVKHDK